MARRKPSRIDDSGPGHDLYRLRASTVEMFTTGCVILDCVLGGGWAYSRVANIVGDKATGKTLLAIEAAANFGIANPKGKIVYAECEAAFDEDYAESLGLPVDRVEFPEIATVEDLFEDLEKRLKSKVRTLYIVDSLDALSDRAEQERKIDKGTYGTKASQVSALFRRINKRLSKSKLTLMVVSQVRDNIGVTFGERNKRSGGRALDFYATHAIWLHGAQKIKKTRGGIQREIGLNIRVKCKKNKVGPPFRECTFPLIYGYGMEDLAASLEFLILVKKTKAIGMTAVNAGKLLKKLDHLTFDEYEEERANVGSAVREVWAAIETTFQPKRRKYQQAQAKKS